MSLEFCIRKLCIVTRWIKVTIQCYKVLKYANVSNTYDLHRFAFKMQNITRKMTNKTLPNAAVPL